MENQTFCGRKPAYPVQLNSPIFDYKFIQEQYTGAENRLNYGNEMLSVSAKILTILGNSHLKSEPIMRCGDESYLLDTQYFCYNCIKKQHDKIIQKKNYKQNNDKAKRQIIEEDKREELEDSTNKNKKQQNNNQKGLEQIQQHQDQQKLIQTNFNNIQQDNQSDQHKIIGQSFKYKNYDDKKLDPQAKTYTNLQIQQPEIKEETELQPNLNKNQSDQNNTDHQQSISFILAANQVEMTDSQFQLIYSEASKIETDQQWQAQQNINPKSIQKVDTLQVLPILNPNFLQIKRPNNQENDLTIKQEQELQQNSNNDNCIQKQSNETKTKKQSDQLKYLLLQRQKYLKQQQQQQQISEEKKLVREQEKKLLREEKKLLREQEKKNKRELKKLERTRKKRKNQNDDQQDVQIDSEKVNIHLVENKAQFNENQFIAQQVLEETELLETDLSQKQTNQSNAQTIPNMNQFAVCIDTEQRTKKLEPTSFKFSFKNNNQIFQQSREYDSDQDQMASNNDGGFNQNAIRVNNDDKQDSKRNMTWDVKIEEEENSEQSEKINQKNSAEDLNLELANKKLPKRKRQQEQETIQKQQNKKAQKKISKINLIVEKANNWLEIQENIDKQYQLQQELLDLQQKYEQDKITINYEYQKKFLDRKQEFEKQAYELKLLIQMLQEKQPKQTVD